MARYLILFIIFCAQCGLAAAAAAAGGGAAPFVGNSVSKSPCKGDSAPTRGPWDYTARGSLPGELKLIEKHHFNKNVENLKRGQTSQTPEADLYFTLRHWPNHHRALNSISIYGKKLKANGKSLKIPAECWLQRAFNFSPGFQQHFVICHLSPS